jgi:hypothetical protein
MTGAKRHMIHDFGIFTFQLFHFTHFDLTYVTNISTLLNKSLSFIKHFLKSKV